MTITAQDAAAQDAARITRYLDIHTPMPAQADLVFVFGTRHPEPAYIASDLVERGIGRYPGSCHLFCFREGQI